MRVFFRVFCYIVDDLRVEVACDWAFLLMLVHLIMIFNSVWPLNPINLFI